MHLLRGQADVSDRRSIILASDNGLPAASGLLNLTPLLRGVILIRQAHLGLALDF